MNGDDDNDNNSNLSIPAPILDAAGNSGSITETITVPFAADITPSRHAKILRQLANCLHALMANSMRYAAIGDGRNLGAGHPIHQQTYAAAGNLDAAANAIEHGQRAVVDPSTMPPPPGSKVVRMH